MSYCAKYVSDENTILITKFLPLAHKKYLLMNIDIIFYNIHLLVELKYQVSPMSWIALVHTYNFKIFYRLNRICMG